jgi:hypothetical protein
MEFFVKTNYLQCSIQLEFETNSNDLVIIGSDPSKKNTDYFKTFVDNHIFDFNLPKSPKLLKITVFDQKEGNVAVSNKFKVKYNGLFKINKQPLFVDQDTKEFIDFSMDFSEKAGYLPTGNYYSKNKKFLIKLLPSIEGNKGTPSRVHMLDNYIEVSKQWFDSMTVAGRQAILSHEFAHNHLNDESLTDNNEIEEDADDAAYSIYRALGFSKFEWMNAWAYIFNEKNEKHIERFINSDINLRNSV